jgi:DNA-binding MarR family transcriptional regulator
MSSADPPAGPGPGSLVTSATFLLVAAGRQAGRRLDAALAADGVTLRHVGALGHLAARPDISYSDLARRAGITPQSMRATIRQLEDAGAVRRTSTGQGRRARLEVTEPGRALLARVAAAAHDLDTELLADVPDADRGALRRLLLGIVMPDGPPRPAP